MQQVTSNLLFANDAVRVISWTLLHSLWQGLFLGIIAVIIIILTKKSSPALRHGLFVTLFFLFLVSTCTTFVWEIFSTNVHSSTSGNTSITITPSVGTAEFKGLTEIIANKNVVDQLVNFLNANTNLFFAVWLVVFCIKSFRLFTDLAYVSRIRKQKTRLPEESWRARLILLSQKLNIRKSVSLLESEIARVPLVVGIIKPAILLPIGLLNNLSIEETEAILLHELAHIRRRDYLVNMIQSFAETVFFFNPALLWLSSLIREERENCCDDIAVKNSGNNVAYIKALVSFEEFNLLTPKYATALYGSNDHLLRRVKRIIHNENKKLNTMEKSIFIFSIVTVGLLGALSMKNPVRAPQIPKANSNISQTVPGPNRIRKEGSIRDTTQPKPQFSNITTNSNDDGKTRRATIEATNQKGNKYKLLRVDGKLTELYVDGKKIPESNFKDYADDIKALDEQAIYRNADEMKKVLMAKEMAENKELLEERMKILKQQQLNMSDDNLPLEEQLKLQKELALRSEALSNEALLKKLSQSTDNAAEARLKANIEAIEQNKKALSLMNGQNLDVLKADEFKRQLELSTENQLLLQKKLQELAKSNDLEDYKKMALQQQMAADNFELANKARMEAEMNNLLVEKDKIARAAAGLNNNVSMEEGRAMVKNIIEDLVNAKIVTNSKSINWFALTNSELIVNGKKQSPELQMKLREKYRVSSDFGIYYGNVPISGKGIFFSKEK